MLAVPLICPGSRVVSGSQDGTMFFAFVGLVALQRWSNEGDRSQSFGQCSGKREL